MKKRSKKRATLGKGSVVKHTVLDSWNCLCKGCICFHGASLRELVEAAISINRHGALDEN